MGGARSRDGEGGKFDMIKSSVPKNNKLLKTARCLRHEMTRHEKHLWYDFLQHYPVKIYKQRIIGNYIVDFYCAAAKLVIELDGSQHHTDEGFELDLERDAYMDQIGLLVLRIPNIDIDRHFQFVCEKIDFIIQDRLT